MGEGNTAGIAMFDAADFARNFRDRPRGADQGAAPAGVAEVVEGHRLVAEAHDSPEAADAGARALASAFLRVNARHERFDGAAAVYLRAQEDVSVGFLDVAVQVAAS